MIHSRAKSISQTQLILSRHFINHIHSHTHKYHRTPKTKSHHQQRPHNHKPTPKPRKPIPFVSDVKAVQDPDEALFLFHDYHKMGFKHDYPSYSSLIYKLARSRNFEAVETILGLIQDRDIRCRDTLFIVLIQHYGKAHLVDKAVELFHRMPSFNCVRTLQSCNTLLNALVDNDLLNDATEIFNRSYKMGFRPNSISFNVLIKGWLQKGEWEQACKMFDEMLEKKVEPSVVTYNCLIGFLSRKGDLDKAMSLFEDMIPKGKHPNAITYALLMEGLCSVGKVGDFEGGLNVLNAMLTSRHCPRSETFKCLIMGLLKCGKIDAACFVLEEMEKRKIQFDLEAWEALVGDACSGDGVFDDELTEGNELTVFVEPFLSFFGGPLNCYLKIQSCSHGWYWF
nr:pentatricopeptide repeat-containing protein, mitochondrial [Quercus suber]